MSAPFSSSVASRRIVRLSLLLLGVACADPFQGAFPARAAEFEEDFERVIALRSKGELLITNNRGDIVIEGWAQDKIRVRARRRASVDSEAEARKLFAAMDLTHRVNDGSTEVSAEYGRGLTLEERLRERQSPRTSMELSILAPASRALRVWAVNGRVTVKGWKGAVDIRSSSGPVLLENVRGDAISVVCPSCSVQLSSVRGTVRCMGGSGTILLNDIAGPSVYVESDAGAIRATRIAGEQLYVSKTGHVLVQNMQGHAEFHTQSANVEVLEGQGLVSGRTSSGNITLRMQRWRFSDKALIESVRGSIDLELPRSFSGELDVRSAFGKVEVDLPMSRTPKNEAQPVVAGSHRSGTVGDGGEILRVFSERGDVRLRRGK